jgi:division protein 1
MKPHLIGSASNDASTSSAVDAHESSPLSKKLDFAALGRAPRSIGLGTRRITSKDLEIEEATSELLDAEVPDPDGLASEVSLLRGFNATIPSSGRGKSRRRKTREVHVPAMGLKKMGMSARGLLSESDTGEGDNRTDSMRRNAPRGRRGRESLSATVKLGKDELVTQKREILQDKENLQIRRVRSSEYPAIRLAQSTSSPS